jgi:acetyl/propionyl-CoA carboxylase alpha subunit
VGYPLLVKAVSGGGGIGMQLVHDEDDLDAAIESCRRRSEQAFGDSRVFLEHFIDKPRHVEVQFLADAHGEVVALGDRECSVQRRHQKLVEESPAPALSALQYPDYTREALFEATIRIAKAAGYTNAGTCEFIMDARGRYYFLEVNARLQVEHPVTEMCTGLDLVELQLLIAQGEPISDHVIQCVPSGHAIEARVCAEDPARQFLPSPGKVEQCRWASGPGGKVRIESGIQEGDTVTPYYDSMVAKVIAYDSKRHEAVLLLDRMLAGSTIAPLKTNISFLRKVLNDPAFQAGQYDTGFVERLQTRS